MVTSAVQQFLSDTEWGELDFLILDLPPGTGDIQLTIVQTVPLSGAVIVSTPQRVALADARKGVGMFDQVEVPVLGVVENMAYFTPPGQTEKYEIFGKGGGEQIEAEFGIPLLHQMPIDPSVREGGDVGRPVVWSHPDSSIAAAFRELAGKVAAQVSKANAD